MDCIGTLSPSTEVQKLERALNPVRLLLTDAMIEGACLAAGHSWRGRVWTPVLTILACVFKQLLPSGSARSVEDIFASLPLDPDPACREGSALCAARKRLPEAIFNRLQRSTGLGASREAERFFAGLRVVVVDGTTVRTDNTSSNKKEFGCSKNKAGSSRLPLARLLVVLCAGCGAVLNCAVGAYRTSEIALFLQLLEEGLEGQLLVADGLFCSFMTLALAQRRSLHVLVCDARPRKRQRLKRLGYKDDLQEWGRPGTRHVARPDLLEVCPETLRVRVVTRTLRRRGYRSWTLRLATTLLDAQKYKADDLVDLYLLRWNVEVDLRTLKTHYNMAHLKGKTPDIVRKEIASILVAYNCVIDIQRRSGKAPRSLSHKRTRLLIITYAERMAGACVRDLLALYKALLKMVAAIHLRENERLPQPRALIFRTQKYPPLMTTRKQWRRSYVA